MRNAAAATFACLVIASSARAQLNFELDDYRGNDDEYPSQVDPWFDAAGDPDCVYIPGRLNMAAGDVVLSKDPNSVIYKLLSSLGYQHSHSGMAMSERRFRHNTAIDDAIDTVDSNFVPQRLKGTGEHSLRDAWPGMINQTVEAATSTGEFFLADGMVIYSADDFDSQENIDLRRAQRERALDQFARFRGYYSFHAYTDISWLDPYTKALGSGNMCAGSIYHAHRLAQNVAWGPESVRYFPEDVRQPAADLLYNDLRRLIRDKPDWFGEIVFAISGLVSTSLDDFAKRASNQIINCMAFDDCGNTGGRWRDGVGDGASLAPDDILILAFIHAFGESAESPFVYNSARPLEEAGSYYCCTGWNSGRFIIDGYTTLTCSGG